MPSLPNIVLTGFMGTGKSTVGRVVAERTGRTFIDTDSLIESRHGPIPRIFAERGEGAFRAIERDVAAELGGRRDLVVATGGGMLLDEASRRSLAADAVVLCLTARPATILARVLADGTDDRPLLRDDDPASRIEELLEGRAEAYGRFPAVLTDDRSPEAVADEIIAFADRTRDPRIWLEDVEGHEALAWVRERNAAAESTLFSDRLFTELRTDVLEVLEARDRIAYPSLHGDMVHNFWTDADHPRGVLRRTTWGDYRTGDPTWEILLDVDELGAAEGESWVLQASVTRRPDRRRALVDLSPGGSDASVTRELDLVERRFVRPEEGGFARPVGKGGCAWIDDDTIYVMCERGPGTTTRSGYPRQVRRWERGTPLDETEVVFEGTPDDVSVSAGVATLPGFRHHVFRRALDFYTAEHWLLVDGNPVRIEVPVDVDVSVHGPWMAFENRKDWTIAGAVHPGGSLLVAPIDHFLAGRIDPVPVFHPTARAALAASFWTRSHLVLNVMEDVRNHLETVQLPDRAEEASTFDWARSRLTGTPDVWTLAAGPVDADLSDDLWVMGNDLVTPETLYRMPIGGRAELLRQAPHRFDTDRLRIHQHFATSTDGTRIPYFEVSTTTISGPRPTLLGGYGGFEVPRLPSYAPALGRSWLAAGHSYALANIRGGGEYGPQWHQAGLREHRHRVYEDFEAVARDLIDRGVTTPTQLGCAGGSNGGLLVGNMYVRCPELWGAIVCQVPLLDMARYHRLLAGASWMAEYGDPDDPDDWAFIRTFSPYHLVDPATDHPPILLTTSTRDDRVHPGHARKFAALLGELGKDVTYWENIEGGHGGAADAAQQATMQGLLYTFLRRRLAASPDDR